MKTSKKLTQLLKANVHLGHNISCWNSKMFPYIYNEKNGLHIIDLIQTIDLLEKACKFLYEIALNKKIILFIGTKSEAINIIATEASRASSPYINHKWLGGTLTNWNTIQNSITDLKNLEQKKKKITTRLNKEKSILKKKIKKSSFIFNGIKNMKNIPDVIIIIDQHIEKIAIQEAKALNIPIISIIDTNCDPDLIDIPIPGNDDSTHSIQLILNKLTNSIIDGYNNSKKFN